MLPLTDGVGINYSVRQMLPLTDGAEYKLFGTNIYPHHSWWGFLLRRTMKIPYHGNADL